VSSELRIVNGKVYDPANGVEGEVRDICIQDGRIVESVTPQAKRIDAQGMIVMPGGIDIHCHIAGPKVNLGRKLQPEDHRLDVHPGTPYTRSGTGGIVPSTFATGYRYTALGYTTAMEAAVPPIFARHVLEELHDTPVIDKGFYVLLGNNVLLNRLLKEGRQEDFRQAVAWWLNVTKAYTAKLVNPGGDEPWKGRRNANITTLDEKFDSFDITPRQLIQAFVQTVSDLGLPTRLISTATISAIAGITKLPSRPCALRRDGVSISRIFSLTAMAAKWAKTPPRRDQRLPSTSTPTQT
jgi:Formylmethanofuran dehydrogenase subunit A